MPRIVLSRSAVDKLFADPMLRRWREGELGRTLPVLWYFRRAYSIRHADGVLTEHGDGFSLTFCEPEALDQPALARRTVTIADGIDIVVVAGQRLLSDDLLIGWRAWAYVCEPLNSLPDCL